MHTQLAYLLLVTSAIFVTVFLYPSTETHWLVWTGLTMALISLGRHFVHRLEAICVTALSCLLVVWLGEYFNVSWLTLTIFLFSLSAYLTLFAERYAAYAYPVFVVNLFAILVSYSPTYVGGNWERMASMSTGVAIVLIGQFVFLYRFQERQWYTLVLAALNNLRKLNQEIFSCLLQSEYADNVYIFERRIHTQKEALLQSMVLLSETKQTDLQTTFVRKINLLFDITLNYAQLRHRVSDYNVLDVCHDEMQVIATSINELFVTAQQRVRRQLFNLDVQPLLISIQRLEDNYQQVLQVTAKEPLVFLLFIASLRAFAEEMMNLD